MEYRGARDWSGLLGRRGLRNRKDVRDGGRERTETSPMQEPSLKKGSVEQTTLLEDESEVLSPILRRKGLSRGPGSLIGLRGGEYKGGTDEG